MFPVPYLSPIRRVSPLRIRIWRRIKGTRPSCPHFFFPQFPHFPPALIFLPGKRLSPRGYFVRHAPFAWGSILPKPLRHRPGGPPGFANGPPAPPEFLPQSRRSRLRRHQRTPREGDFPLLTNRLASGFATTTRVSPSFALRAATRVIPLPRGLTSSRSLGIRNPPFNLSARRKCGCRMRLEMGPELQAARGVLPKQKFWKALGRLSRSSPSQSTFFIPIGHCPFMRGTGLHPEEPRTPNTIGGWRSRSFRPVPLPRLDRCDSGTFPANGGNTPNNTNQTHPPMDPNEKEPKSQAPWAPPKPVLPDPASERFAAAPLLPTPNEIIAMLDKKVVGQLEAKRTLAVAAYHHFLSCALGELSNWQVEPTSVLLVGPTGSGKSHLLKTLRECLKIPMVFVSCTNLTQNGYKGVNVNEILERLENELVEDNRTQPAIVVWDEVDKLRELPSTHPVSTCGVQQDLLTYLDGTRCGKSGLLDCSRLLNVACGAFVGLDKLRRRDSAPRIGFVQSIPRFGFGPGRITGATLIPTHYRLWIYSGVRGQIFFDHRTGSPRFRHATPNSNGGGGESSRREKAYV